MNDRNASNRRAFLKTAALAGVAGAEFVQASQHSFAKAMGNLLRSPSLPRLDPEGEVRVGLIGSGGHCDLILNSIPLVPGARLAAVALTDGETGAEHDATRRERDRPFARHEIQAHPAFHQRTRIYEAYPEMLSREDLDVVAACLPSCLNAQALLAAAHSGCHVIAGKPLATHFNSLAALESVMREGKVEITAMLPWRLHPGITAARKAVADGLIGKPVVAFAQNSVAGIDELELPHTHDGSSNPSFPWNGVHPLDSLSYTTGLEITQASVLRSESGHGTLDRAEDIPGVLLKLANNATGIVSLNCLPLRTATHAGDRLRLAGTEGVITIDSEGVKITTGDGATRKLPLVPCPSVLASFVAFLRGQASPIVTAEEAVHINRVWLTVRQAAEEGRVLKAC